MKKTIIIVLSLIIISSLSLQFFAAEPKLYEEKDGAIILNINDQKSLDKYFVWDSAGCAHKVVDGVWTITLDGSTWWAIADITNQLHFDMEEYPIYGIHYKVEGISQPQVLFYNFTRESEASGTNQSEVRHANLKNDGQWHTSIVDMDGDITMMGELSTFRIDVIDASMGTSGTMYIDSIVIAKTKEACQAFLGEDTPENSDDSYSKDDAIVTSDNVIAYRMGSNYIIDEYFPWSPANCVTSVKDKLWRIDLNDCIGIADISNQVRINLDDFTFIAVRYKTENITDGAIQFYTWTDIRESTGEERVDINMNCDGNWHIGVLDNRENVWLTDMLNTLRIDVCNNAGNDGTVYIDYILFAKSLDAAKGFDEDGEWPEIVSDSTETETISQEESDTVTETDETTDETNEMSRTIADTEVVPGTTADDDPENRSKTALYIIISAVAVMVIIGIVMVIVAKKK